MSWEEELRRGLLPAQQRSDEDQRARERKRAEDRRMGMEAFRPVVLDIIRTLDETNRTIARTTVNSSMMMCGNTRSIQFQGHSLEVDYRDPLQVIISVDGQEHTRVSYDTQSGRVRTSTGRAPHDWGGLFKDIILGVMNKGE